VAKRTTSQPVHDPSVILGTFITFEGGEGVGKSTQAAMLMSRLETDGKDAILVREPGGTPIGSKIRELLLEPGAPIAPVTEALLFAADRAQQVKDVIKPALQKGKIVISDRFVDSSLAYQGVGRGCGLEPVKNLNDWATGGLEPNLTVFLDLPVEDGLARVAGRELDRIEREKREFHENVRYAYSMLQRIYSYRYITVDATGTPEMVHQRVFREVSKII